MARPVLVSANRSMPDRTRATVRPPGAGRASEYSCPAAPVSSPSTSCLLARGTSQAWRRPAPPEVKRVRSSTEKDTESPPPTYRWSCSPCERIPHDCAAVLGGGRHAPAVVGVHDVVDRLRVTSEGSALRPQGPGVVSVDAVQHGDGECRPVGAQVHRRRTVVGDERACRRGDEATGGQVVHAERSISSLGDVEKVTVWAQCGLGERRSAGPRTPARRGRPGPRPWSVLRGPTPFAGRRAEARRPSGCRRG